MAATSGREAGGLVLSSHSWASRACACVLVRESLVHMRPAFPVSVFKTRDARARSGKLSFLTLQKAGVRFVAADMPEANEMVVGIMAVVAQAERKMISARTKAALQAAKARGKKLGGLRYRKDGSIVKLTLEAIAVGRAARTAKSVARATDVAPIIADLKSSGAVSLRQFAAGLNERGIPTARGGEWSAVQVQRVMNRVG
jgi:hypothetical protein